MVDGAPLTVSLWDTAGQEDYDHLRPLSYPNTDVFMICTSVISPISFQNVKTKWAPEINHYCPGVPYIIVGTKTDLRNESHVTNTLQAQGTTPITKEAGEQMAKDIKAICYVECSAMTQEGLKEVFDRVIKEGLLAKKKPKTKKKKVCTIL